MKNFSLIANVLLILIHAGMVFYVNTRNTFDKIGQEVLLFYYSYTMYIVLFIILNSFLVLIVKSNKYTRYATLALGGLAVLFYVVTYNDFNPY
jgi:TctA family transporter